MGVAEELGGSGASCVALVLVAQQAGRHIAPIPLVESMAANNLLARAGARDLVSRPTTAPSPRWPCVRPSMAAAAGARGRHLPTSSIVLQGDELVALRRKTPARRPTRAARRISGCSPIADVDLKDPQFERVKLASGADARTLVRRRAVGVDPAHGGGAGRPSRRRHRPGRKAHQWNARPSV